MSAGRSPNPAEQRAEPVLDAELGAGQPERGDGLVDRAVGLGPEVVLGDPGAAEEEAGRAVVAACAVATAESRSGLASVVTGSVAVGRHHIRPASRGSQRSASRVTLTSCSTTDSACSLTCWIIDPA